MRILFINLSSNPLEELHPRHELPPLEIAYSSAILKNQGHETFFYDISVQNPSFDSIKKLMGDCNPDYIFLKVGITSIKLSKKIASFYKDRTVVFGPLPTLSPEIFLKSNIKYLIPGEIEKSILDFFKNKKKYTKIHKKIPIVNDIDSLPLPDYSIFLGKKYKFFYPTGLKKKLKFGFLQSSRGCPYNCIFCTPLERSSFGKRWRPKSVKKIIKEVDLLMYLGINFIYFVDDLFTFDKKRTINFCKMISKRKINWAIQTRVDRLDDDLLRILEESGCTTICLGIESGSNRILRKLKKGFFVEDTIKISEKISKTKMRIVAFVMVGNPTETRNEIQDTMNLIKKIKPDFLQIAFFTPFPGSKFYTHYKIKPNLIKSRHEYPSKKISCLDINELIELRQRLYLDFYLNPKIFFRSIQRNMISSIVNFDMAFYLIKRAIKFFLRKKMIS